MTPSSADLPEMRPWLPADAVLHWAFDEEKQCVASPIIPYCFEEVFALGACPGRFLLELRNRYCSSQEDEGFRLWDAPGSEGRQLATQRRCHEGSHDKARKDVCKAQDGRESQNPAVLNSPSKSFLSLHPSMLDRFCSCAGGCRVVDATSVFCALCRVCCRCPPSGANPTDLAGHPVNKEDDVLYIKKLPDFDGRINESDSELLITYLTAPYIRCCSLLSIPLCQPRLFHSAFYAVGLTVCCHLCASASCLC